jgi:alpha-L-rhamnosidase
MKAVAEALGKEEDVAYYEDLYQKIRSAYITEYVDDEGRMPQELQGLYVIALKNDLVSDEAQPKMIAHLKDMIEQNDNCLDTGFLSVLFLMDVLCENGLRDLAYKLLFQTKCPSWLYEVEHGATTMWESWGAVLEDGTVSSYSYNHYAFGCVGEWLYKEIGGLSAKEPGYKTMLINPAYDCGLTSASVSEQTPYGQAKVEWKLNHGEAELMVEVPVNTQAEIVLGQGKVETVGSGSYHFSIAL